MAKTHEERITKHGERITKLETDAKRDQKDIETLFGLVSTMTERIGTIKLIAVIIALLIASDHSLFKTIVTSLTTGG